MQGFDLAVVGASFAGLACAGAAAARGVRTVVLDRKREAGARVRTTGLVVKEAAEAWDLPGRLVRPLSRVRVHFPSGRTIDVDAPGAYLLATDTPALLRWLAERARECGAEVRFFRDVAALLRRREGFELPEADLRARFVVGADGARSRVATALGLGRNRAFLRGAEVELEGVRGPSADLVHCLLDPELAPGYLAWVVPGVGTTQVGLACRPPAPPRIGPLLRRFARLLDLSRARIVGRRGGPIPVGGIVRPLHADGALLVGDAAGMASPLTAGGIATALRFGRRAGHLVADHLLDGGAEPGAALFRELPSWLGKRLLRAAYDRLPLVAAADAALASPLVRAVARRVFFHRWRARPAAPVTASPSRLASRGG